MCHCIKEDELVFRMWAILDYKYLDDEKQKILRMLGITKGHPIHGR